MLGHTVTVYLLSPDTHVRGELRKQTAEGVWLYHGMAEKAALHFYPQHRISEIEDNGPIYR
jgi:hypothetical protein